MITKDEIIEKANSIKRDLDDYEYIKKSHEGMIAALEAEILRLKEENKSLKEINDIEEPEEEDEYIEYENDSKTGFFRRY
jgi:hypothetical protein